MSFFSLEAKSSQLATHLRQQPNAFSYLAYPTSLFSFTVNALSTTAEAAKSLTTQGRSFSAAVAPSVARLTMTAKRAMRPYPFQSVQILINLLIDTCAAEAKELLKIPINKNTLLEIESSAAFEPAVRRIYQSIVESQTHLHELIVKDIEFARQKETADSITALHSLEFLINTSFENEMGPRPLAAFRELLLNVIVCMCGSYEHYDLAKEASMTVGRLLLSPEERLYTSYLENQIEKNVRKLMQDERPMRILGKGNVLLGKTKIASDDQDAFDFICVYTTIEELQNKSHPACPDTSRQEKLEKAKEGLKTFLEGQSLANEDQGDGKVFLTKDICSDIESEVFTLIKELGQQMYNSKLMKLPYFDLSSWGQTTGKADRFMRSWNRGKTAIPEKL